MLESYSRDQQTGTFHVAVLVLLAVLAGVAYSNALEGAYVADDYPIIVRNKTVTDLRNIPTLFASDYWANYRGADESGPPASSGLYRPFTMTTYAINYALHGLSARGYHLTNILMHVIDTWLVYLVAGGIGLSVGAAGIAAAVFAVHPIHTEAVTGVVGRAELLMTFGVLGAFWAAILGRWGWSMLAFTVGLFSKEQAIVFPGLLLLYELCLAKTVIPSRSWAEWMVWTRGRVGRYVGYGLLLAVYGIARTMALGGFPLPPVTAIENPLIDLLWQPRLFTALKVAGLYLKLFLWPGQLVADYSAEAIPIAPSISEAGVIVGLLGWGGLLSLAIWAFGRRPAIFVSAVMVIVTFFPVSNLLVTIGTIMAERLFYLPSAGLCLLVGLAWETMENSTSSRMVKAAGVTVIALSCAALTLRTIDRNRDWKDPEALFRSAIAYAPGNTKAYIFLGGALRDKGKYVEAVDAYEEAKRRHPEYVVQDAHFNAELGGILFKLGRFAEATSAFEQAVTLDPEWGRVRNQLAMAYAATGNVARAEQVIRYAITKHPKSPDLRSTLSTVLNDAGRFQEALEVAESALQQEPLHAWAQVNRAIALEGLGRTGEAITGYQQLLRLDPSRESASALDEARDRLHALQAVPQQPQTSPSPEPKGRLCTPGLIGC